MPIWIGVLSGMRQRQMELTSQVFSFYLERGWRAGIEDEVL